MGAVDPDRVTDEDTMKKLVDKVIEDRKNFLDFLFLCNNDTRIENLKFVSDKRAEIKKKIQDKQRTVTNLLLRNLDDEESINHAEKCLLEVQNLKHMVPLFDTDCLELYAKLSKDLDELTAKLPKIKVKTNIKTIR